MYYKYEDDYHNLTPFTTDADGEYTYTQDLSMDHLVFIQPRESTKFIKDNSAGGDCWLIGTWDASSKTCTLTMNVNETIQIDNNGITLDGNWNTVTGTGTGSGVYVYGRSGITIKNLSARNFGFGIYLNNSNNNIISSNTLSANIVHGIYLQSSSNNNVISNTSNSNPGAGIAASDYSNSNNVIGNATSDNGMGIHFTRNCTGNTLRGNTIAANHGDPAYYSGSGIYLYRSSNSNTVTGNTISSNQNWGIVVRLSTNSNTIYNNNLINNPTQVVVRDYSSSFFNLSAPIGGNYWSNCDTPAEGCNDTNGDNFCDSPYVFTGGQDNLPWTWQNGWLDNTPPTTTDNAPLTWQQADFTVLLACTDNPGGTGCKETRYRIDGGSWQTGNSISITTEGDYLLEYYSIDNIGNQEEVKSTYAKLDKTPPVIDGALTTAPNANGWYKSDVVVCFTAADALSGLDTVTPDITISSEGANQSVTGTATDRAGNSASFTVTGINIDKVPPQVTITTPGNLDSYLLNENLPANWSATDELSGISSATGTVPPGGAINTETAGTKSFSVSATDKAGNQITQTVTYYVVYVYSGILQPVNSDGSSLFKRGRTVPVKFRLQDANGDYVANATAHIYLAKINEGILGSEIEAISTSAATTGNLFRYDPIDKQYIFNLGTKTLTTGTWQIRILLDDGISQYVTMSLK
jgi:parallel beta-helix repeat protein